MNEAILQIESKPGSRKGVLVLSVRLGDKPLFTNEVKIANADARVKFIEKLCDKCPSIEREEVSAYLEELAAKQSSKQKRETPAVTSIYECTSSGIVWWKTTSEGPMPVQLTNFNARIVADILRDDGIEKMRSYEIEASVKKNTFRFPVPASRFSSMAWCSENLGAEAVVSAGYGQKDHARAAIQELSDDIENRVVYVHTGWRTINGHAYYLHADGAIGAEGPEEGIQVELPVDLSGFVLPPPPDEELPDSITSSLDLLDLGPKHITFTLFAAIWRAALGNTDFSLHLAGATGVFKTEVAGLIQSFFGTGFNARSLPGTWSSTENALEELCFLAKDAIIVVDDFAPTGSSHEVYRYHKKADRVIRAQGNRSGRGRLMSNGTLKRSRPPRGMMLSTGEDIPAGQSLRARLMVLELSQDDVQKDNLSRCQGTAYTGLYAKVMSGFLRWGASRYEEIRTRLKERIPELREQASKEGQHNRIPTIVAELYAGFEVFADFAADHNVHVEKLRDECWRYLCEAAQAQARHQEASEPTTVFLQLLNSAISSGEAHVADRKGNAPKEERPETLGWVVLEENDYSPDWKAQGARVGWIDGDDLYLDPSAVFKAAQRMATDTDRISVQKNTLMKLLRERGHLRIWDKGRGKNTVRQTLQGKRRNVLHLGASVLGERVREYIDETYIEDTGTGFGAQNKLDFNPGPGFESIIDDETTAEVGLGPGGPEGTASENDIIKKTVKKPSAEAEEEMEWTG